MDKKAFTLVELIVVASMLVLLGLVGILTFTNYLEGVRDTTRVSQVQNICDGLELGISKGDLYLPTDKVEIQINGKKEMYQGVLGQNILDLIEFSGKGIDPKDKTYLTYSLSGNGKYYQLTTFLESDSNMPNLGDSDITLLDYNGRVAYIYGNNKVGIFSDINNNLLSSASGSIINIEDSSPDIYNVQFKNDEYITSNGSNLITKIKEIKQN